MEVPLAIIGTVAALLSAVLVSSGLARSRRKSAGTPSKTEAGSATSGLSLSSVLGVVSVLLLLIANIFITIDVVSGNKEPAILFLLWVLFAGGAIFFAARIFASGRQARTRSRNS